MNYDQRRQLRVGDLETLLETYTRDQLLSEIVNSLFSDTLKRNETQEIDTLLGVVKRLHAEGAHITEEIIYITTVKTIYVDERFGRLLYTLLSCGGIFNFDRLKDVKWNNLISHTIANIAYTLENDSALSEKVPDTIAQTIHGMAGFLIFVGPRGKKIQMNIERKRRTVLKY